MQYDDNVIIGESESPDCPQNGEGGYCIKSDKTGIMLGSGLNGGKSQFLTMESSRPHWKAKSDATWASQTVLNRNTFKNF